MAQLLCSDNNNNDNSIIIDNGNNNTIDPKKEKKNDTRPALAVCIQGKTRTFVSPLAQESLRINLASAFGARHTAFYFHLAPVDRRGGWAMDQENKKLRHATPQESLNAVANVLGVSVTEDLTLQKEPHPLLGGMVVSSAASDNHHHHNHPNNTINIDATNVHVYRLKKETNTDGGDPTIICDNDGVEILIDERDDDEIFDYNLRNYNTTGNCKKQIHEFAKHGKSRRPYVASSVAQWSAFEECHEFVTRQEEKQGYKFDYGMCRTDDVLFCYLLLRTYCVVSIFVAVWIVCVCVSFVAVVVFEIRKHMKN